MKKFFLLLLITLSFGNLNAQETPNRSFISYYEQSPFMQASPGAFRYGLHGYLNPAVIGMSNRTEMSFMVNDLNGNFEKAPMAFLYNIGGLSYGNITRYIGDEKYSDNRISLGFGDRNFSMGFGYGWMTGENSYKFNDIITFGMLYRPNPYLSIGYTLVGNTNENIDANYENIVEVGVRPIKNYPLTFYVDATAAKYKYGADINGIYKDNKDDFKTIDWSAGISWEVVDGIRINGRYFSDERLTLGFDVSFGPLSAGMISSSPTTDNMDNLTNTYAYRLTTGDRSILTDLIEDEDGYYVKMNLAGNLQVSNSIIDLISGGGKSQSLTDILNQLDGVKESKYIKGVVINISKFSANYATMWEVRSKLEQVKASGKEIIIFSENYGIRNYHLASVADKVVLEPMGIMTMEGFAMSRSYHKDFLDKFGIGYDEIRLFKYKSAVENMARNKMSEGDREQRQDLVNDWYEYARKEICASRDISEKDFDNIVDNDLIILPKQAKELKLIDYTYRWNVIDSLIKDLHKDTKIRPACGKKVDMMPYDNHWSEQARKIAIVYAEGVCAMETGIQGRNLSKLMESVLSNDKYEAVILRVNSPGGSAMASDYVAEVIRKHKGKKPILVSQGSVAASGGYWLSMDADTILATPMTVTGSIGVIASWIYDKGMADSLGINYELVKRGQHSDVGQPVTLPFLPIGLPARKLTDGELTNFKNMISESYGDFVRKVADGRGVDSAKIGKIAQGHFYSGIRGKKIGLVDEIGGIDKAIEIAKVLMKYKKGEELDIIELRPKAPLQLPFPLNILTSTSTKETSKDIFMNMMDDELRIRVENNGKPLVIVPYDTYSPVMNK